jgi:hypothetical protein
MTSPTRRPRVAGLPLPRVTTLEAIASDVKSVLRQGKRARRPRCRARRFGGSIRPSRQFVIPAADDLMAAMAPARLHAVAADSFGIDRRFLAKCEGRRRRPPRITVPPAPVAWVPLATCFFIGHQGVVFD